MWVKIRGELDKRTGLETQREQGEETGKDHWGHCILLHPQSPAWLRFAHSSNVNRSSSYNPQALLPVRAQL